MTVMAEVIRMKSHDCRSCDLIVVVTVPTSVRNASAAHTTAVPALDHPMSDNVPHADHRCAADMPLMFQDFP
jgi:hypothetical protein